MCMEINTIILALAIGSFVFGFILLLFQYGKEPSAKIPFWVVAKFLQGTGSLLLYFGDALPESGIILVANPLLLTGCAYEGWAVFHITGRKIQRHLHLCATACIVTACVAMFYLNPPNRLAVHFFIHTIFYSLPGWALLKSAEEKSLLRSGLGYSFLLLAAIFLARSLWAFFVPAQSHLMFGFMIYQVMLPLVYCMMLVSGFSMLLLAKEKSDQKLKDALCEQEALFQTLPAGLCFLRDRIILRCNPSLERIFGYAPGVLIGKHISCLYASEEDAEKYGRLIYERFKHSNFFEGEIPAVRQNGERFWSWIQGAAIFPERSHSYSIFSATDMTQQKMQQETLLRQKDKLEAALARVKHLEGIIPICMYCKKIRDDKNSWHQLETLVSHRQVTDGTLMLRPLEITGVFESATAERGSVCAGI